MQEQVSLEQAVAALKKQYGPSLVMGFEDGKDDMAKTLEKELAIDAGQAKQAVEALVETHTIEWVSSSAGLPNPEGTMGMVVQEATWQLGD
jgi:hypothetical protein